MEEESMEWNLLSLVGKGVNPYTVKVCQVCATCFPTKNLLS